MHSSLNALFLELAAALRKYTGCTQGEAECALEPFFLIIWTKATDANLRENLP